MTYQERMAKARAVLGTIRILPRRLGGKTAKMLIRHHENRIAAHQQELAACKNEEDAQRVRMYLDYHKNILARLKRRH
jgi:hypothetical protein